MRHLSANGENTIKLQLVGLDSNFKSLKVRPVRLSWFWQRTLESVLHLDSGSQVSVILILPKTLRPIFHKPQGVNLTCNVFFVRDPEALSLHVSLNDSQKSVLGAELAPQPCTAYGDNETCTCDFYAEQKR